MLGEVKRNAVSDHMDALQNVVVAIRVSDVPSCVERLVKSRFPVAAISSAPRCDPMVGANCMDCDEAG